MNKRVSQSSKAGITFPVARIKRNLRTKTKLRSMKTATVYLAAVLQYTCAEILDVARTIACQNKKYRITPRFIYMAVAMDAELKELLKGVVIPQGGVMPFIHPELLPRQKVPKSKKTNACASNDVAQVDAATSNDAAEADATISSACSNNVPPEESCPDVSRDSSINNESSISGDQPVQETIIDVRTLWEEKMFLGPKLTFLEGNFLKMSVDAVVIPTDADFSLNSFAARRLISVLGEELMESVQQLKANNGPLKPLDAIISPTSSETVKDIIYCFGPSSDENEPARKLDELVERCLVLADDKHLKSLAIPILELSYLPDQQAVNVVLRAITNYFLSVTCTSLIQIYFIQHEFCNCNSCKNLGEILEYLHKK